MIQQSSPMSRSRFDEETQSKQSAADCGNRARQGCAFRLDVPRSGDQDRKYSQPPVRSAERNSWPPASEDDYCDEQQPAPNCAHCAHATANMLTRLAKFILLAIVPAA
jgi:hypothetical protein